jgi:hypothetical protein
MSSPAFAGVSITHVDRQGGRLVLSLERLPREKWFQPAVMTADRNHPNTGAYARTWQPVFAMALANFRVY